MTYNFTQSNWFVPESDAARQAKPGPQSKSLQQVSEQYEPPLMHLPLLHSALAAQVSPTALVPPLNEPQKRSPSEWMQARLMVPAQSFELQHDFVHAPAVRHSPLWHDAPDEQSARKPPLPGFLPQAITCRVLPGSVRRTQYCAPEQSESAQQVSKH